MKIANFLTVEDSPQLAAGSFQLMKLDIGSKKDKLKKAGYLMVPRFTVQG